MYFYATLTSIFDWFLCLMAYQPLWVIQRKSHLCRTTVEQLFRPFLVG